MKIAGRILAAVAIAATAAALAFWLYLDRSLPQLDGDAAVHGLAAQVEILRDKDGVPHIFAKNERDGWFAMGYMHAQDRLWQMDFQRRIAEGRLAEILGERAYDTDRLMRTLGIARVAAAVAAKQDKDTAANFEAYAAGINAYLDSDPVLPIEFHVFGVKPERWKPADCMGWLLVMAWDLSGNYRNELARVRFAAKLGRDRVNEILPPYPGEAPAPIPDFKQLYAELEPMAGSLLAATPPHDEAVGSNNWAVDGTRSETGKPLLANDPHLGVQTPSLWYLAHVSTPAGNVVGGTLPGIPYIVLGRNDSLAWSFTATNGDVEDLFVERIVPGDPSRYVTPKGNAKFDTRDEVIRVGSEERHVTVRSTRHGPVISDVVKSVSEAAPKGHVLALSWSALTEDNGAARAGLALNHARNRAEFLAALKGFDAPNLSAVYADRDGHIGMVAPGLIPVRRADNEAMGRVPVPGWIAKYDWQGFIPYEKLPAIQDPPSHHVVTANHKITPPGYREFIASDWFWPYRADRIETMLAAVPKHSLDSFARMQADVASPAAAELLDFARSAKPSTDAGREAQAMLAGWKGAMAADEAAPLVFAAWYRELTRLVYADELGDIFHEFWEHRLPFMTSVIKGQRGLERWCDDIRTPVKETCAMRAATAFDLAAADLKKRYGAPSEWRWGQAHRVAGDHRPLGFVPLIGRIFNIDPETPGDAYTVDVGNFYLRDEERPFANRHAPGFRALYDLADLDRSRFMQSTGQSGNVLSPWYSNLAERWRRVEYITIPAKRELIHAEHTLVLKPS